jgi:hypothetical protein
MPPMAPTGGVRGRVCVWRCSGSCEDDCAGASKEDTGSCGLGMREWTATAVHRSGMGKIIFLA